MELPDVAPPAAAAAGGDQDHRNFLRSRRPSRSRSRRRSHVPVGYLHPETFELRAKVQAQNLQVLSAQEKIDQARSNLKILTGELQSHKALLTCYNAELNAMIRAADKKMMRVVVPQVTRAHILPAMGPEDSVSLAEGVPVVLAGDGGAAAAEAAAAEGDAADAGEAVAAEAVAAEHDADEPHAPLNHESE